MDWLVWFEVRKQAFLGGVLEQWGRFCGPPPFPGQLLLKVGFGVRGHWGLASLLLSGRGSQTLWGPQREVHVGSQASQFPSCTTLFGSHFLCLNMSASESGGCELFF